MLEKRQKSLETSSRRVFSNARKKHIMAVSISFKHSGLTALVNKRLSYVNFSLEIGNGIVLEIIVKV